MDDFRIIWKSQNFPPGGVARWRTTSRPRCRRRSASASTTSASRRKCRKASRAPTASCRSTTRRTGRWCARWRRSSGQAFNRDGVREGKSERRGRRGREEEVSAVWQHDCALRSWSREGVRARQAGARRHHLDVAARGITAIIGPSGTGKSTLIRCINRLVEPTAGRDPVRRPRPREARPAPSCARRAASIGMVFQEYNLVERLTVMENLLSGRLGYVLAVQGVAAALSAGGHRARVRAARHGRAGAASPTSAPTRSPAASASASASRARVMQEPKLLLADEPTSSLDPKTSVEIMELMARRRAAQRASR